MSLDAGSIEQATDALMQLAKALPHAALLAHICERGQGISRIPVEGKRLEKRFFRLGMPALSHVQGGQVGLNMDVVGRELCRFAQARLRAGEVVYFLLRKRALQPHRRRNAAANGSRVLVHDGSIGVAARAVVKIGEIEERVRMLRLPR